MLEAILKFEFWVSNCESSVLCLPAVQFYGHIGGKPARVRLVALCCCLLWYDKSL